MSKRKVLPTRPSTVLIGMPSYSGMIPAATVASLLQLHKPLPCAFMTVERQRIDKARNACVLEALRNNVDYLFFVDDDNPIPPETLEVLLSADKDVVFAPILGRVPDRQGRHPLCAFYAREVTVDGRPLRLYHNITTFRDSGPLHRVDAGGTGCVLIKRRVLEALYARHQGYVFEFGDIRFEQKVMVDGVEYDRRTMSEDCEFSERAVDAGFELWLDERIRPLHMTGTQMVQWQAVPNG
jgi:glycosyltransferase involved in cell wall biosynthesis